MTDPNLTLLLVSSSTGGTINYTECVAAARYPAP